MPEEHVKPEIVLATKLDLWGPTHIFYSELDRELYYCTAYVGYIPKKRINLISIEATRNIDGETYWYLTMCRDRRLHDPARPWNTPYEKLESKMRKMMVKENIVDASHFEDAINQQMVRRRKPKAPVQV